MYQPTNTRSPSILTQRVNHVATFLEYLGNPEKKLKIIHVTGTSGKGSVVTLLHHIIHASGHDVGSIISPHTTTFLERFSLNEGLVSARSLIEGIEVVEDAYELYLQKHSPLSFFALSAALGLYMFAQKSVPWVVLEVGIGGRFDSTNAIAHTEASIITNVDKDHTDIMGHTLEEIAFQKAGIIKPHGLAIVGEERPRLKKIFTDEAIAQEAALFFANKSLPEFESDHNLPHVNRNIRIAALVAQELGFSSECIARGIATYRALPCRFETISTNPTIILDGAHNPAKIQTTIDQMKQLDGKPIILFGTGSGKDASLMLRKLYPYASKIHTTRTQMDFKKAASPATLIKMVPAGRRGKGFLNPHEALQEIQKTLKKSDILLVTGSLYLAGELREHWYPEAKIIKQSTSFPI